MAKKKNPAAKKPGRPAAGGRDTFVVASKVKSYIRGMLADDGKPLMASSELSDALSLRVQELLDEAIERCKGNGRKVVRSVDL